MELMIKSIAKIDFLRNRKFALIEKLAYINNEYEEMKAMKLELLVAIKHNFITDGALLTAKYDETIQRWGELSVKYTEKIAEIDEELKEISKILEKFTAKPTKTKVDETESK